MERGKTFFTIFGTLFIVIGVVATTYSAVTGLASQVIWYCYSGLIISGIALLRRDGALIGSQLLVLTLPYLAWNVDFFYQLLTGVPLWGITDYFFTVGPLLPKITTLQHVITIPILLYAVSLTKMREKETWKLATLTIIIIFAMSRLLTLPIDNVNCAYRSCVSFLTLTWWYPLVWFISMALMMVVTYYVLVRWNVTEV